MAAFDMRREEFAEPETVRHHGLNCGIERQIAKAIGLHSDLHAVDFGVDLFGRKRQRNAGERHFGEVSSGVHDEINHNEPMRRSAFFAVLLWASSAAAQWIPLNPVT